MQAIDVAGKGRPTREWKVFEKETIIEHITKNREKLGLSRTRLTAVREEILAAEGVTYQSLVNAIYSDDKLRRSLLNFTASTIRKKEGERRYEMIGVSGSVKEVFASMKDELGYESSDVSTFMADLLTVFKIVYDEREKAGLANLPVSELKGRLYCEKQN